jgi:ABC-type Mn2+/Zn2+ transport system permease subunit
MNLDKITATLISILFLSLAVGIVAIARVEYLAVALLTSVMMGIVSPLIAARRLYFLASEYPHMALLATTLSIILVNTTPVNYEFFWVIVIGLISMYLVGYAIHRGVDPDIATSIATAGSVSASVMVMYIALRMFRVSYSLWSLILGDPLLVTHRDIYVLAMLTFVVVVVSIAIYEAVIYMGIDRDTSTLIYGRMVHLYDFLFFTVIGLTTLAVLKIVGYILEHVLLLLPALVAINLVEGGRKVMITSLFISTIATLLGFSLSIKLNLAPASSTGFIILAMYLISIAVKRLRKYG